MFALFSPLLLSLSGLHVGTPLADVFVDASAANCTSGVGSSSDPVCSIGAAVALAALGDTNRIAPGTYVKNVALPFDLDLIGTGGAAVTFVDGGARGRNSQ